MGPANGGATTALCNGVARHLIALHLGCRGGWLGDPRFNLKVSAGERFDFFNAAVSTGYPNS
jgi:hypothetical protein